MNPQAGDPIVVLLLSAVIGLFVVARAPGTGRAHDYTLPRYVAAGIAAAVLAFIVIWSILTP